MKSALFTEFNEAIESETAAGGLIETERAKQRAMTNERRFEAKSVQAHYAIKSMQKLKCHMHSIPFHSM